MSGDQGTNHLSPEKGLKLAELAGAALRSSGLEDLSGHILPFLSQLFGSFGILLYLVERQLEKLRFQAYDCHEADDSKIS